MNVAQPGSRFARRLPGLYLLRTYRRERFRSDVVAGLSVAAVALPIGIAYAQLAGFPPVVGIYSCILPLVAYALFGSSRQLVVNPDAAACSIVAVTVAPLAAGSADRYLELSILLTTLTGLLLMGGGLAGFGVIANFLSRPVLTGYLNGIALTIIAGQIGALLGFKIPSQGFFRTVADGVSRLNEMHLKTFIVGAGLLVLTRFFLVVVFVAAFSVLARSQAQDMGARKELWPEVDVFVPLNEKVRLFFVAAITKAEETRDKTEAQAGAHVDYAVNKHLTLRAGYRHGFSLTEEDPFSEHRILAEQTLRRDLPLKVLVTDRSREEFRFINGEYSFRYRNRVMLEREIIVRGRAIIPYGSVEAYRDSRFDAWNRNRLTAGVQIQLKKGFPVLRELTPRNEVILELYYTKQNDSRSDPHHLHAFGTVVAFHF